jgi:uncharacterized damage-inducible protein DinB
MVPFVTLREMFDYNYWARDRQLAACATLRESDLLHSLGGSFPSLQETLAHLVSVEWLWLERWQGRSPRSMPPAEELLDLAAITGRWQAVERAMRQYLAGLTEETLDSPVTYVNFRGEQWTYVLWRMMVHLLLHQSFHRGQVTAMLRRLGIDPPPVDFLVAHDAAAFR